MKIISKKSSDNNRRTAIIILLGLIGLLLVMTFSLTKGGTDIALEGFFKQFLGKSPKTKEYLILMDLRLPRILASVLVGAAFAVSGTIMQGITHNALADPGLMGINSGAGFALSIALAFFPGLAYEKVVFASFLGALFGMILVISVGNFESKDNSMELVLVGLAINTLLTALSQGISIGFNVSQNILFWTVGGLSGVNINQIKVVSPFIIGGLLLAIMLSGRLSTLSLGKDVAKGLGLNIKVVYLLSGITVLILAGTSVALAGSIGFVGIIVPHISRRLVGLDYKNVIPVSAVLGSLLLVLADMGSRMIKPPFETPIGAIISLIGVPFFLYLTGKERRK